MKTLIRKQKPGISLVEVIFSIGLFTIFSFGIAQLTTLGLFTGVQGRSQTRAASAAQEGFEAVVSIRNVGGDSWNWHDTPVNTGSGEYYQPAKDESGWHLGNKLAGSPPAPLSFPNQAFTRTVKIESVARASTCGAVICDIVEAGGVVDVNSRKVTVSVSWQEKGETQLVDFTGYLTNWR